MTDTTRPMELSFLFFSDSGPTRQDGYRLVFDVAEFADRNGFTAVWVPERHLHPFGGSYPNPAVLAAALAQRTRTVRIRAGSVVLPLHHPIEVVEAWGMVDQLSSGRVDLAFASGWNPNDFIISPGTYESLRDVWIDRIPVVQALWRGEPTSFTNPRGEAVSVSVYPRPRQRELAIWLTATKRVETFQLAGSRGYNVLTMLQGTSLAELADKVRVYREARAAHGFDPAAGIVTLMMHTFVHPDAGFVQDIVHEPLLEYIKSGLSGHLQAAGPERRIDDKQRDAIARYSVERYSREAALFGPVEHCAAMLDRAAACGVDEIACLVDFGVEHGQVIDALPHLAELNRRVRGRASGATALLARAVQAFAEERAGANPVAWLACDPGDGVAIELQAAATAASIAVTTGASRGAAWADLALVSRHWLGSDSAARLRQVHRALRPGGLLLTLGPPELPWQGLLEQAGFAGAQVVAAGGGGDTLVLAERGAEPPPGPAAVEPTPPPPSAPGDDGVDAFRAALCAAAVATLHIDPAVFDPGVDLSELGMESVAAGELITTIAAALGVELTPTLFFANPSADALTRAIAREFPAVVAAVYGNTRAAQPAEAVPPVEAAPPAEAPQPERAHITDATPRGAPDIRPATGYPPIAIIGMSGRFPGAPTLEQFWTNLASGTESLSEPPHDRWRDTALDTVQFPEGATPRVGLIDDAGAFDAEFFKISRREAASMDVRQRLVLESVWSAVEDAAIAPGALRGTRTGVFIGVENNEYAGLADPGDPFYSTSTAMCMLANRISYWFDWRGPSEVLDTSCTSSLVAIHRAARAIHAGECEHAVVAGVSVIYSPRYLVGGLANGMLSPSGQCRAFDRDACGSVTGEGVGAVMLKALDAAVRDGDPIHGVLIGGAVNHGGRASSLSAPNPDMQAEVIRDAYDAAGVVGGAVSYAELHGVGHPLLDAVELGALGRVLGDAGASPASCAVGSLTPNIGNLDPASGIAGVIKILLAMRAQELPPTIHVERTSDHVHLEGGPLYLNTRRRAWLAVAAHGQATLRRASIHSYAWGGVNAHLVLEEWPAPRPRDRLAGPDVVVVSARDDDRLRASAAALAAFVSAHPEIALADLAHTLRVARDAMEHRLAVVGADRREVVEALRRFAAGGPDLAAVVHGVVARPSQTGSRNGASGHPSEQLLPDAWAQRWVAGGAPARLAGVEPSARRVHAPGYVFRRTAFAVVPRGAGGPTPPARAVPPVPPAASSQPAAAIIRQALLELLALDPATYDPTRAFTELGIDSLVAAGFAGELGRRLGVAITPRMLFEHATPAALAGHAAGLVVSGEVSAPVAALPRVAHDPARLAAGFAATDLQRAYLLGEGDAFALGGMVAHQYFELEVDEFDVERWQQAWRRMTERHPMLRAVVDDDGTWRVLDRVPELVPVVIDLRGLDGEVATAALARHRDELRRRGPSTRRWPLLELTALAFPGRWVLHYNLALVLMDGLSTRQFFDELDRLHRDPRAELPAIDLDIADYMAALGGLVDHEQYRRAERYWLARIDELPPAPQLPVGRPLHEIRGATLTDQAIAVEPAAWTAIKQIAGRLGVTPSIAVYAVFASILARWSASPRFCVNVLHFNRLPLHPHVGRLIANLSSTILVDTEISTESFAACARRCQAMQQDALDHAVFDGLAVQRERNRRLRRVEPGMPVVFTSLIGADPAARAIADAGPGPRLAFDGVQTPQVTLDCAVFEYQGALQIRWAVLAELFPSGVVDDMLQAMQRALYALAAGPAAWDRPLEVPLLPAQVRMREAANATDAPAPNALLQDGFLVAATRQPDATAIVSRARRIRYGELRRASRAVARWLRSEGVQRDQLVAIVMTKGWEQVAAVLGVLEAGAAYLPIDADLPEARIHALAALGEVSLALTQPALDVRLPDNLRSRAVTAADLQDDGGAGDAAVRARPGDLAYVLFTSGSTGTPKGVMIEHRAAVNTIADITARYRVSSADRVIALSALSFDLSVYDLFGVLGAGGVVVIPDAADTRDPERLAAWVRDERVTLWNSVPAFVEMIEDHLAGCPSDALSSLRLIMMSGDWIPVGLPDRLRRRIPGVELISLGGATECAIWSIAQLIERVDPRWPSIPYGRPLLNQRFHVLDAAYEPCPDHVPGELYIAGLGLARGYWRDPARTAASFVTHPATGERLYRTGDLGCYLGDGSIRFLGRRDGQVKIHGHRIELGEVEAAVRQVFDQRDCIAVAPVAPSGERQLVVYVTGSADEDVTQAVRTALSTRLPSYMVPRHVVVLPSFPTTSNGKVARDRLPAPVARGEAGDRSPILSRTEDALCAIWQDVLGRADVPVTADFFDVGGHSLAAVRLMARIARRFGDSLPLSSLAEHGTIRALARILDERVGSTAAAPSGLVLLERGEGGDQPPLFLIHPVGGHTLAYRALVRHLGGGRTVYGIDARHLREADQRPFGVRDLADDYLALVRAVQPRGPYHLAGWSFGGVVTFAMAEILERGDEQVATLALIDSWVPAGEHKPDETELLRGFVTDLEGGNPQSVGPPLAGPPLAGVEQLLPYLKNRNLFDEDVGVIELKRLYEVYRRNMRALEGYRPRPIRSRITVLRAAGDPPPTLRTNPAYGDPTLGWRQFGPVEVRTLAGDHYSIFREPHVADLARELTQALLGAP